MYATLSGRYHWHTKIKWLIDVNNKICKHQHDNCPCFIYCAQCWLMFSIIQIHIYYMFPCICRVCVINIASWNLTIWSRMCLFSFSFFSKNQECVFVCMVKVQTQEIKLRNYLPSLQRYHMELEKKTRWYLNKRNNKKRKQQQYTTIKAHVSL